MGKLTKEEFCRIMERVQVAFNADMEVERIASLCKSDYLGSDLAFLSNEVIDLLALVMDVNADDICYFCFELDFGRRDRAKADSIEHFDEKTGDWIPEVWDLSSAEKYYDYLMAKV